MKVLEVPFRRSHNQTLLPLLVINFAPSGEKFTVRQSFALDAGESVFQGLQQDIEKLSQPVTEIRRATLAAFEHLVIVLPLGQDRGGFYSYDWLENLFGFDIHTADRILREYQSLKVGDPICMSRDFCPSHVTVLEPNRWLSWQAEGEDGDPVWTFTFGLFPVNEAHTRLVVRESFDNTFMPPAAVAALERLGDRAGERLSTPGPPPSIASSLKSGTFTMRYRSGIRSGSHRHRSLREVERHLGSFGRIGAGLEEPEACLRARVPDPYLVGSDAHSPRFDARELGFDDTLAFAPQLGTLRPRWADGWSFRRFLRNLRAGVFDGRLQVFDYERAWRAIGADEASLEAFEHVAADLMLLSKTDLMPVLEDFDPARAERALYRGRAFIIRDVSRAAFHTHAAHRLDHRSRLLRPHGGRGLRVHEARRREPR